MWNYNNSEKRKKQKQILIIALSVAVLLGICFLALLLVKITKNSSKNDQYIPNKGYSDGIGLSGISADDEKMNSALAEYGKKCTVNVIAQTGDESENCIGLVITSDGYILASSSVVSGADKIDVYIGQKSYTATVAVDEPTLDIAALKIETEELVPANFLLNEEYKTDKPYFLIYRHIASGEIVAGKCDFLGMYASFNDIGAEEKIRFSYTEAFNDGGYIVDDEGNVVGIVSPKHSKIAVLMSAVLPVVNDFFEGKEIFDIPKLGICAESVEKNYSDKFNLPQGLIVTCVKQDSNVKQAGLCKNDIIVSAQGVQITSVDGFAEVLDRIAKHEKVEMKIFRDGDYINITFTLDGSE